MRRDLAFLVPVLGRPHRVQPLLSAIRSATSTGVRVVFIADAGDKDELRAIRGATKGGLRVDTIVAPSGSSYARKINIAVERTSEPLLFFGADDLVPQPGWLEAAKARLRDGVEVVGVNDMIRRRRGRERHATHFVVTRAYAQQPTIDGGRGPLCEAYDHSWVDDEFIATAKRRGVYTYAQDALVRHDHPMAGAPDDATYEKGRARFHEDRQIFNKRSRLWT